MTWQLDQSQTFFLTLLWLHIQTTTVHAGDGGNSSFLFILANKTLLHNNRRDVISHAHKFVIMKIKLYKLAYIKLYPSVTEV